MAHDVFISYSTNDKEAADAICDRVESKGVRCWIAPRDILPGEKWGSAILGAIKGARVMVLVFSKSANAATHVVSEVERAVSAGVIIIPFRLEKIQPEDDLELLLSRTHWFDAYDPPLDRHVEKLALQIKAILDSPRVKKTTVAPKADPSPEPPHKEVAMVVLDPPPSSVVDSKPISLVPKTEKKSWALPVAIVLVVLATVIDLGWYYGMRRSATPAIVIEKVNATTALSTVSASASVAAAAPPSPAAESTKTGQNFTASNGMEMVWVEPLHGWVGKYLVTQDCYKKVMGSNPSHFTGDKNPVEEVSWGEATDYCAKLTQLDGPLGTGKLPPGYRYQLPMDAQYTVFVGDANVEDSVTSRDTPRTSTAPVGSLPANEYGLFDTRGDVWEWCRDWYDEKIERLDSSPHNPEGGLKYKVLRGGAWSSGPTALVTGGRGSHTPIRKDNFVGFRCVAVSDSAP